MSAAAQFSMPSSTSTLSPQHEAQVTAIRDILQKWLKAEAALNKGKSAAKMVMPEAEMIELSEFQVADPFAFIPSPPETYQRVLLSMTKCFWMAFVASLNRDDKNEMKFRLNHIPPFKNRVPRFDGQRCLDKPHELTAKEYEGLMRCTFYASLGMVSDDISKMWGDLGEVGVLTWEEEPYIEHFDEEED